MSDSEGEIGPMPATVPMPEQDGAQAFRERERRMREMEERAAQEPAKSARPEWMVEMPDDSGLAAALRPGASLLRPRGFHQGGRVQRSGGVASETTEEARRLWTETPEQRRQRILRGDTMDAAVGEDESERLARERAARRDAEIREQAQNTDPLRSTSLLEQHRQKRMEELKRKKAGMGPEIRGEQERQKGDDARDEERYRAERRARHESHRARREHDQRYARQASERDSHRARHREDGHRRGHHQEDRHRHKRHRDDRQGEDLHQRQQHHRPRHHGHDHRHDSHAARERSRLPSRKTRAEREAEDLANAQATAPYFDKDKVLGAGSRLMDERARARTVADATELTARFASGSRGAFL